MSKYIDGKIVAFVIMIFIILALSALPMVWFNSFIAFAIIISIVLIGMAIIKAS